jgi:hypothetical protein
MMDLTKVPLNEYGHVQTRDGRDFRLLCIDRTGRYPVLGLTSDDQVIGLTAHGTYCHNGEKSPYDLIPVPRKVRVRGWLNVYPAESGFPDKVSESPVSMSFYWSRAGADKNARDRIACIEIDREVTEGDGL